MRTIQEFIDESQRLSRVSIEEANDQTLKILNANYDDGDWEISSRIQIYDILDLCLQSKQNGNPSDFHNYAVTFAKINDYDAACDVIRCGLKRFPCNVDLLADFLEYAPENSNEDRFLESEKYYQMLKSIEINTWTWRGFSFTIDYLLAKLEQSINAANNIKEELSIIAKKFIESYPTDERAYYSAYLINQRFGDASHNKDALENALALPIRAAHCALRLAEICFEEKDYSQSLIYLNRAINDGIDQNGSLKLVNIYLLRFIIKATILMNSTELVNNSIDLIDDALKQKIKDAYSDYRIAKGLGIEQIKKKSLNQYVKLLELISEIPHEEVLDDIE